MPAEKLTATWDISLNTACPKCEFSIDLTDTDDFWHCGFEPIEHGTKATEDFDVTCPDCGHEFQVDFEY